MGAESGDGAVIGFPLLLVYRSMTALRNLYTSRTAERTTTYLQMSEETSEAWRWIRPYEDPHSNSAGQKFVNQMPHHRESLFSL